MCIIQCFRRSFTVDNQSSFGLKIFVQQDHREFQATEVSKGVQVGGAGVVAGVSMNKGNYNSVFNPTERGELMELVPPKSASIIYIPGRGAYCNLLVQTGNAWEKFQDVRKWMNNGDTLTINDEFIHMLVYAWTLENKSVYNLKVFDDDEKELATVAKESTTRVRIHGQGSYCTIKIEAKSKWEKYQSIREYMRNRDNFTVEESMINLVEGSFVLKNKSTFKIMILVKHDDQKLLEPPVSLQNRGQEIDQSKRVTSALDGVQVKELRPREHERFLIPGKGLFFVLYVWTLGKEWQSFEELPQRVNNNDCLIVDDKKIVEVFAKVNQNRKLPPGNYLFVGNPGVGKSTLASALTGKTLFKSGTSQDGSGVTATLETYHLRDGVTIMDTPGLSDAEKRKQAAKAIEDALSNGGFYRIFFVITQEAGRIRPDDLTTIQIVLDGVKDVTSFGVIINKVSPKMIKKLTKSPEAFQKFKIAITKPLTNAPTPNIIMNVRSLELEDANCSEFEDSDADEDGHHSFKYTITDKLFNFVTKEVVGFMRVDKKVQLNLKSYDELSKQMGERMAKFEEVINNMTTAQAKEIERLQRESEESVRKIQEEAANESRRLKEEQEKEALMAQRHIEEAEKKSQVATKQFNLQLQRLREEEKKAREAVEAGLAERDTKWQNQIEQMERQREEEIRKRDQKLLELQDKKRQDQLSYMKKLEEQQKQFNKKLVNESKKSSSGVSEKLYGIKDSFMGVFRSSEQKIMDKKKKEYEQKENSTKSVDKRKKKNRGPGIGVSKSSKDQRLHKTEDERKERYIGKVSKQPKQKGLKRRKNMEEVQRKRIGSKKGELEQKESTTKFVSKKKKKNRDVNEKLNETESPSMLLSESSKVLIKHIEEHEQKQYYNEKVLKQLKQNESKQGKKIEDVPELY